MYGKLIDGQLLVVLMLFCGVFGTKNSFEGNPLNGKSLQVITHNYFDIAIVKKNATGHVIFFDGLLKQHIDHLAMMFNFSYNIIPNSPSTVDSSVSSKGMIDFLVSGEADIIVAVILGTASRFKYADFPTPFIDDTGVSCLVSYPKERLSLIASLKPLSYQAWSFIGSSIIAITIYLRFSKFFSSRWLQSNRPTESPTASDSTWQITYFVWGNLVSQGQSLSSTQMAVRIAAGAWCAGCFFLIQIYCSTLTSHLMSPNQKPIISSVNELPYTHGVSLTVDKGYALDILLRFTPQETRSLKFLSEMIKNNPKLRCTSTPECLQIVDEGYAVYCNDITSLKTLMRNDLKATGSCHYLPIKDTLLNGFVFTPLQKNSPYTEFISRGTLIFKQAGLSDTWLSWYSSTPWQCMKLPSDSGILRRISISNLSSAFTILLIGYILSIFAFCCEKIIKFFSTRI